MEPWVKHEIIGRGGTSLAIRVTRHICLDHHQEGCLKELREELRTLRSAVEYFRAEGAIAADLRHPNIVGLLDADLDNHRLVFELVDGCDLHRLTEVAGGKVTAPLAIRVASELLRALSWSHSLTRAGKPAGILHRDLSPKNVLISHAGDVKLMDFGCAGRAKEAMSSLRGTGPYMSPEQVLSKVLDERSDLFSLAVILFELVTGEHPYATGNSGSTFERIARGTHTPVMELEPSTPPELAAIITRSLRPNPDERFASADAMFDALAPLAPSPLVVRELGSLAKKAFSRQTKDYGALKAQRMSIPSSPPMTPIAANPTPPPARRNSRRWAFTGLSAAGALAIFATAYQTGFMGWPARAAAPPAAVEAPRATAPDTSAAAASSQEPSVHAEPASANADLPSTPVDPPPSPPSLTATVNTSIPQAQPAAETKKPQLKQAMLHITAAPPVEIRIGKRSYGVSSVVHAQLAPGIYTVTAGSHKRRVTLRADEERDEFFDLTKPEN